MELPYGDFGPSYHKLVGPNFYTIEVKKSGQILVNKRAVTDRKFQKSLTDLKLEKREPIVRFKPDANAPYGVSLTVLGQLDRHGLLGHNFCLGEFEQYQSFESAGGTTLTILSSLPPEWEVVENCAMLRKYESDAETRSAL